MILKYICKRMKDLASIHRQTEVWKQGSLATPVWLTELPEETKLCIIVDLWFGTYIYIHISYIYHVPSYNDCIQYMYQLIHKWLCKCVVTGVDSRLPLNWLKWAEEPVTPQLVHLNKCYDQIFSQPGETGPFIGVSTDQVAQARLTLSRAEEPVSFARHLLDKCYAIQAACYQTVGQVLRYTSYLLSNCSAAWLLFLYSQLPQHTSKTCEI